MDGAKNCITISDIVDQHADSDKVVDVVEVPASNHHLLVDAVMVLGSTFDLGGYSFSLEIASELFDHLAGQLLPPRRSIRDESVDLLILLRLQSAEGNIFQLPLHGVDPETMRQRCIDI